jgi:hypothetical protein
MLQFRNTTGAVSGFRAIYRAVAQERRVDEVVAQ